MAKAELYIKNGSSWVNYNLLNAYPVGAIYASANSTSPASLFGGSWTQITNAALRGSTWVGYGGSDTHILSVNEMPSHSHTCGVGIVQQAAGQHRNLMTTNHVWPSADGVQINPTGGASNVACPTLLQLLYVATYKLNLQEVM